MLHEFVSQVLRVVAIPIGVKIYITDVHFTTPDGNNSGWPTFAGISKKS
jgi:hypothetical protein